MLALTGVVMLLTVGPGLNRRRTALQQHTDEVSLQASAPVKTYSPTSGLSFEVEQELTTFLDELNTGPAAHDWRFLHQEWFNLTRQWFERLYADPAMYDGYVRTWLAKRKETKEWRISCRREFFPDLTDRELFDKIDWLREQDEWGEMEAKIHQGLERIEHHYSVGLTELLGENYHAFVNLHGIFMKEHLADRQNALYFL